MKILGIIAEFNPFHNGHKYLIDTCMKNTGADFCVIAMSGDFVQRGTPAIINAEKRAEMAVRAGASLVVQLDPYSSTGSAEYFAEGAVRLFNSLGVIDHLCFGSESGEIKPLKNISDILSREDARYKESLNKNLISGLSYPKAREIAVAQYTECDSSLLESPNNLLAIEYLKAISKTKSNMQPLTIGRIGSSHESLKIEKTFSSAGALRRSIENGDMDILSGLMPDYSYKILSESFKRDCPMTMDDFSAELGYALRMNLENLEDFYDMPSDLADRIRNQLDNYENFSSFAELLKTKNRTFTSICRALIHVLLWMKKREKNDRDPSYAKILALRDDSRDLMQLLSRKTSIPLIYRVSDAKSLLSGDEIDRYMKEMQISYLYEMAVRRKFGGDFINPFKKKIVKVCK